MAGKKSITEVECLVSDMAGIPRGKIVPVNKFKSAIMRDNTLRLPEYVFGQLVTGEYMDSEVLQETGGRYQSRSRCQLFLAGALV